MGTDFDQSTAKYVIRARIDIDGVVDKPDVVGAIFGQTEGLLGEDLDLRELQRTGRIGRIQIAVRSEGGSSKGEIVIPVSLNKTATAILAASLETVDRVGPCTAKVTLEKLEDIRGAKRRKVVSRAISILKGWEEDIAPGSEEITHAVTRASKKSIGKFGADKLPAGPELESSDEIIIVEGRADIINLMKNGILNTVAVEGTHISKTIMELTKNSNKKIIAFLDGDRGGDLILRELMQVARIDYIARAPEGKEVEDLTRREITKALQSKIPADQALALVRKPQTATSSKRKRMVRTRKEPSKKPPSKSRENRLREQHISPPRDERRMEIDPAFIEKAAEIRESFKAVLFESPEQVLAECPVAELTKTLEDYEHVHAIIFDGVVTQRVVEMATKKGTAILVGAALADIDKPRGTPKVFTFDDIIKS